MGRISVRVLGFGLAICTWLPLVQATDPTVAPGKKTDVEEATADVTTAYGSTAYGSTAEKIAPLPPAALFVSGGADALLGRETIAARMLRQASHQVPRELIKFEIRIISVNAETRDQIYALADPESITTEITAIEDQESLIVENEPSSSASFHRTVSGSVISSATIDDARMFAVLAAVRDNENSNLVSAPTMIVAPGQTGAIQKKVQRPFLSKMNEVLVEDQVSFETGIEVLDEGVDLAVEGEWEGDQLTVRTKLQQSRIASVRNLKIYGIGESPKSLQLPTQEIRLAALSKQVAEGDTVLMDPFFEQTQRRTKTEISPTLKAVPYAGQMFGKQVTEDVRTTMLVLITGRKYVPKENAPADANQLANPVRQASATTDQQAK
ncbi:hypothetical protein [Roseiconus lacunae]|uniref:hypothetical protein n=1 Tax=Roseiconus lacunae TaxID=2605694 RepID=UPI001E345238|nr:hypothetical protein [Roseiconus lacunae]MCD0463153.1 hypothetical protein [Roseiconus lacunae]